MSCSWLLPRMVCIERADGSFVDSSRVVIECEDGRLVPPGLTPVEDIAHVIKPGEDIRFHRGRLPDRGTYELRRAQA